ncbi:MAG: DUF4290 domain-containing protein [Saprospiraceae bacterium]|jgi:hypothetical protein
MTNPNIQFAYNTSQTELIMPEYGRNVQDLIVHCKKIEDPIYRQSFAEEIINLMQIMTPYNRNFDEHRRKLWHHFFRIASYEIDVTTPYGDKPSADLDKLRPQKVPYPIPADRYRHYGNYVNTLIKKAMEMEAGPKRDEFSQIIGSYMKMAFKNWNREHYVSDELIKSDLLNMSNGQLTIDESVQFNTLANSAVKSQRRVYKGMNKQNYRNKKNNNYRGKSNNNNNNKRRP